MSTSDSASLRRASAAVPVVHAWLTPAELLLLGAVWGASFLFMRIAAKDFGAFALVEVRLALGALILSPFLFRVKAQLNASQWLRLLGIGIINSAAPFVLFAWAAQRAPAGVVAISNATVVMFTSLVAFLLYGEKISRRSAAGLLAGFIGVAVLASGKTSGDSVLPAALAGVFASILYGFGGNFTRRYLGDLPSSAVAAGTVLCASIVVLPLAIATVLGIRRDAGRFVHGPGVLPLLPVAVSDRCASNLDGDLSRAAVRRHLGLGILERTAHPQHGCSRRPDFGRCGIEPAASGGAPVSRPASRQVNLR